MHVVEGKKKSLNPANNRMTKRYSKHQFNRNRQCEWKRESEAQEAQEETRLKIQFPCLFPPSFVQERRHKPTSASEWSGKTPSSSFPALQGCRGWPRLPAMVGVGWGQGAKAGSMTCGTALLPTSRQKGQVALPPTFPHMGRSLQPLPHISGWQRATIGVKKDPGYHWTNIKIQPPS